MPNDFTKGALILLILFFGGGYLLYINFELPDVFNKYSVQKKALVLSSRPVSNSISPGAEKLVLFFTIDDSVFVVTQKHISQRSTHTGQSVQIKLDPDNPKNLRISKKYVLENRDLAAFWAFTDTSYTYIHLKNGLFILEHKLLGGVIDSAFIGSYGWENDTVLNCRSLKDSIELNSFIIRVSEERLTLFHKDSRTEFEEYSIEPWSEIMEDLLFSEMEVIL